MKTKMTEEKAQYIKDNYQTMSCSTLSKQLGVSDNVIRAWCKKNGYTCANYTRNIRELLRQNSAHMSLKELQALLKRHGFERKIEAIRHALRKMSLNRFTRPAPITEEAKRFVEAHYQELGDIALMKALQRNGHTATHGQIGWHLRRMGLKRAKNLWYRPPTEEEEALRRSQQSRRWRNEQLVIQYGLSPRTKLQNITRAAQIANRKLTTAQVLAVRAMARKEWRQFAEDAGVDISTIIRAAKGRTYRDVTQNNTRRFI